MSNDIICLGDNIGYGPEPDEVVKELSKRKIVSVMGNHELALLRSSYYNRLEFHYQRFTGYHKKASFA